MNDITDILMQQIRNGVTDGLYAVRNQFVSDVEKSISDAYPPASAPGSPPHMRTGELFAGVGGEVVSSQDFIELTLFDDVHYAIYLEEGTSKMAARPFFNPAFSRTAKMITGDISKAIGKL